MTLVKYKKKRDFTKTSEPKVKLASKKHAGRGKLRFVVQEHHASHLHYDFRLELGGVLKSWAVPKGPTLDPNVRRLAVMVEDHPLEYRKFEGEIPHGNYGAGMVYIWDQGTYYPRKAIVDPDTYLDAKELRLHEKILVEGLRKGHITFILEGEKLHGEFALVQDKKSARNWYLLKKHDQYIDQDLASTFIQPMKSTLVDNAFNKPGWIFEIKWDGYRTIAKVQKHKVQLTSRNNLSFNQQFSPIARSLQQVSYDAIFDGEVVVLDEQGRSHFQSLQDYRRTGQGARFARGRSTHEVHQGELIYYVFDLLYYNGKDLRRVPLLERKKILKKILPTLPNIRFSNHVEKYGKSLYKTALNHGLEGIMAKNGGSFYYEGLRSTEWLKIKILQKQEAVIAGITAPSGSRKGFGALVLGVYENGFRGRNKDLGRADKLVYIGHTGTGFKEKELCELEIRFKRYFTHASPFEHEPKVNAPVRWMKPKLVCEVGFSEWTHDGVMRQPRFLGLREDKDPLEVKREIPRPFSSVEKIKPESVNGGDKQNFTNLDKIFWPKEKYTKGDLIQYYERIWPFIRPYLKDRPQSLNRFPHGIKGKSFYHKDMQLDVPPWLKIEKIYSETEEKYIHYVIANNKESLLYLINLGCIEINVWNSMINHLDHPDYLVIDLDPVSISFTRVIETALALRNLFDKAGAESFCKTSGATGLHVYVPLRARYTTEQVIKFGQIIAYTIHAKLPNITSIERNPKSRKRKVYIDFLQNRKHQTMASAYAVRPRPGAPVSTPLRWEEVKSGLNPTDFTMKNIFSRLDTYGDLWKGVLSKGIYMEKTLQKLEKIGLNF